MNAIGRSASINMQHPSILRILLSLPMICILLGTALSLALKLYARLTHHPELNMSGRGKHLVVMLHGFGGNPAEFDNLATLFHPRDFTLMRPMLGSRLGALAYTVEQTGERIARQLQTAIDSLPGSFSRLSVIGNSAGGLVAIEVAKRLNVSAEIGKEHLIMIATPHWGLLTSNFDWKNEWRRTGYFYWQDRWRLQAAVVLRGMLHEAVGLVKFATGFWLSPLGGSLVLRYPSLAYLGFQEEHHYYVDGLDFMVPFESATSRVRMGLLEDPRNPRAHRSSHAVSIGSVLKHGSLVGKWRDAWFTWDPQSVMDSMWHIRNRFGK